MSVRIQTIIWNGYFFSSKINNYCQHSVTWFYNLKSLYLRHYFSRCHFIEPVLRNANHTLWVQLVSVVIRIVIQVYIYFIIQLSFSLFNLPKALRHLWNLFIKNVFIPWHSFSHPGIMINSDSRSGMHRRSSGVSCCDLWGSSGEWRKTSGTNRYIYTASQTSSLDTPSHLMFFLDK